MKQSLLGRPLPNARPDLIDSDSAQPPMFRAPPEPRDKKPLNMAALFGQGQRLVPRFTESGHP